MMSKEWKIAGQWPDRDLAAQEWRVSPLIAQLLYNREITSADHARQFLEPKLSDLVDPAQLPGATEAAQHIVDLAKQQKKIVIYGDYDVDGITGTSILWHVLELGDANVDYYIPHRIEEGYGLNQDALTQLHRDGASLVISVDCGITATEAADHAKELGLDLIITDHHSTQDRLPACLQIVHPTALADSPNPHLCGAGVAFKLAWAIAQRFSNAERVTEKFKNFLVDALGLAALGTVADVVPLVGENRIMTRYGLATLPKSSILGIQALIRSAGLEDSPIDSYDVGFKLGPRLNAAGRMGHARLAVELMTRANEERAKEIADYLEHQNKARQSLERKIHSQAREVVLASDMDRDHCRAIVVAQEGWHPGVIGIVASRLVDEFHRPAVMISINDGIGQGSARSVPHFHMHNALTHCQSDLLSFGGHAMAAGLKVEQDKINEFCTSFTTHANNQLTAKDLVPTLSIDAQSSLQELDEDTVRAILRMGPFGVSNPKPRLACDWVDLVGDARCVGRDGNHLQFAVQQGQTMRKAIGFRLGKHLQELKDHRRCKLAFEPIINEFRGNRTVELQIADIQFPEG